MIFFQNLVPGKQDSPFIDRFKESCLETEDDEELKEDREQLLTIYPPVLSFKNNKQEKEFYESEAQSCSQFCCGGVAQLSPEYNPSENTPLPDNYKLSIGTGTLYEGSASEIASKLGKDTSVERFGSPRQEQQIAGMKDFAAIVSQRTPEAVSEGPARQAPNP